MQNCGESYLQLELNLYRYLLVRQLVHCRPHPTPVGIVILPHH